MKNKTQIIQPRREEDFAKVVPTRNPNPEELLFLGGYQGEMLRELATAGMDTIFDDEYNWFPLLQGKGHSLEKD